MPRVGRRSEVHVAPAAGRLYPGRSVCGRGLCSWAPDLCHWIAVSGPALRLVERKSTAREPEEAPDKANAVGKWRGVESLEGMGVVLRLGSAGATSEMGRPTIIQDGSGSGSGIPFKVGLSYTGNGSVHTYQDYI